MDRGHKDADKDLKKLERKLKKEYQQAYEEMSEKTNAWLKQFRVTDLEKYSLLEDGAISYDEYIQWRKNAMLSTAQMNGICEDLARTLTGYNQTATGMINANARSAFIQNYNYGAYEICKNAGVNFGFDLVDEKTVNRLIKENPKLLPKAKVAVKKDMKWNEKKVRSALTQGILQGDSIDKIANRLKAVAKMSDSAAVRNARTMTTSAENGGRMAVYEEAQDMGIELEKTWVATLDDRTRDAHIELDGVTIPIDQPFENSIGKIMYPADPEADDENVYNCRCTLISSMKGYKRDLSTRQTASSLGNWTYDTWKRDAMERAEEKKKR